MLPPVSSRLRLAAALVAGGVLTALAALPAQAHAAPRLRPCPGQSAFACGTLRVPLDHDRRVPGTIGLRFAAARGFRRGAPVLIALTGGPGQPGVAFANSFAVSLAPATRRFRLVVLDQRGTGRSSLLRCPSVQRLRDLSLYRPQAVAACAQRIGPRRAFFSTADTVLDLDALRRALGVPKIALMGISYGTHVALQYARAFPQNVDRLILDSIVGPDGPDPFLLDTYRAIPRILREQCQGTRCQGITRHPVADVAALVNRLNTRGPLRGTFFDARGRRRRTSYRNPEQLWDLLIAGDLNPSLRAALPGAIAAARRGDLAALMRLRRIAAGPPTPARELSGGLFVTTGCEDAQMPFSLLTPIPQRPALGQAALAAIPPAEYAPFDARTVLGTGYVDDCVLWPNDTVRPPFTGPLPDVPALLLGGRLDMRTPIANALATARELPHSTVVELAGSGHDAIDSDQTGCTQRALARFIAGRRVGRPCAGRDNTSLFPRFAPPRSLRAYRSAPGVGGRRGRVVFAVLDTVEDALVAGFMDLDAGLPDRGGGLRGGSFSGTDTGLRLRRYVFVPRLRVSGRLHVNRRGLLVGRVRATGVHGASGELVLDGRGGAAGRLGGRRVRFSAAGAEARAAAVRRAAGTLLVRVRPHRPLPDYAR